MTWKEGEYLTSVAGRETVAIGVLLLIRGLIVAGRVECELAQGLPVAAWMARRCRPCRGAT